MLLPLAGAPLCYILHKKNAALGNSLSVIICFAILALSVIFAVEVSQGAALELTIRTFGGFGLSIKADGFRTIYLAITAFMWLAATLFGREYFVNGKNTGRFHFFSLLTLAATAGVFLSADLFTTFLFFEWVSLASFPLVIHDGSSKAHSAAQTYIAIAIIGGLTMLMGLFLLYGMTGTLEISELSAACAVIADKPRLYTAAALLMVGFGAKAGVFPLHIWLPQAHPAAPAPASALLSGVLTKTGVFGVVIISCELLPGDISWGIAMLILGTITMLLGAVLALFSVDLKRTLACSSISQIGFIIVGIAAQSLLGHHNALAVRGTILHMVNHSLVKLLLFTAAGVIYMNLHKLDLNDIKGWGHDKPLLKVAFLAGSLNLAGVPFFSGYVSKTLLHESLVECIHMYEGLPVASLLSLAEILFLLAGGLTTAYMTKLFIAIFVEKPDKPHKNSPYMSNSTTAILMFLAVILPVFGALPHQLPENLAAFGEGFMHGHAPEHAVHYFDWINLRGFVISLVVGVFVYIIIVLGLLTRRRAEGGSEYLNRWPAKLDLERQISGFVRFVATVIPKRKENSRTVSRFYEKYYWLFYPEKLDSHAQQTKTGSFSFGLLMLGIGLSAVLAWMLWIY